MKLSIDQTGTTTNFERLLGQLQEDSIFAVVVLACSANEFTPDSIDPILKSCKKPIFGGIFPEIFAEGSRFSKGTICIGIESEVHTLVLKDIDQSEETIPQRLKPMAESGTDIQTLFSFIDPYTDKKSLLIDGMFDVFGHKVNYLGGGCGDLDKGQMPSLITPDGLIDNAAILIGTHMQTGIGVKHGWKPVSAPFKVTEAVDNKIISLDGKPAGDVYLEFIRNKYGPDSIKPEFQETAQAHPFGIARLDSEYVVRDPYKITAKQEILCFGDVPQGSHVVIMSGAPEALIRAAQEAKQAAMQGASPSKRPVTFFIDCISRAKYLKENFTQEISIVKGNDSLMVGACTIGEIANNGKEYLEFYNKTAVVAILSEE